MWVVPWAAQSRKYISNHRSMVESVALRAGLPHAQPCEGLRKALQPAHLSLCEEARILAGTERPDELGVDEVA